MWHWKKILLVKAKGTTDWCVWRHWLVLVHVWSGGTQSPDWLWMKNPDGNWSWEAFLWSFVAQCAWTVKSVFPAFDETENFDFKHVRLEKRKREKAKCTFLQKRSSTRLVRRHEPQWENRMKLQFCSLREREKERKIEWKKERMQEREKGSVTKNHNVYQFFMVPWNLTKSFQKIALVDFWHNHPNSITQRCFMKSSRLEWNLSRNSSRSAPGLVQSHLDVLGLSLDTVRGKNVYSRWGTSAVCVFVRLHREKRCLTLIFVAINLFNKQWTFRKRKQVDSFQTHVNGANFLTAKTQIPLI